MYGFTIRSKISGVSRTSIVCCAEYCSGEIISDKITLSPKRHHLPNVNLRGWANYIDFDFWSILGLVEPCEQPAILKPRIRHIVLISP